MRGGGWHRHGVFAAGEETHHVGKARGLPRDPHLGNLSVGGESVLQLALTAGEVVERGTSRAVTKEVGEGVKGGERDARKKWGGTREAPHVYTDAATAATCTTSAARLHWIGHRPRLVTHIRWLQTSDR